MNSIIDDKQVQQDVMHELEWDPEVTSSDVGVAVIDGIVTLSGQVDSYWAKKAAENAAKRVKGVRGIVEDIVVKYAGMERTDVDIADTVVRSLKWSSSIPDDALTVKVESGSVTIEGQVPWEFQRSAAERIVEKIKGVKSINNFITIKPRVQASIVKSTIKQALERSADVEAGKIEVETVGNTVTLRGTVRTWNERAEVQRAAWSTPGVTGVENLLTVGW